MVDRSSCKKIVNCAFSNFDLKKFDSDEGISCAIADEKLATHVLRECGLVIAKEPMEYLVGFHLKLYEVGFYDLKHSTVIDGSAVVHPCYWINDVGVPIGTNTKIGAKSILEKHCFFLILTMITRDNRWAGFQWSSINFNQTLQPPYCA